MEIDINKLRETIEKDIEDSGSDSKSSGMKILYPAEDGKLTVRLLYNVKSGTVQRKIVRHDTGSGKVPCLQVYGEECPICSAISSIESAKGKECGVFGKYGYKTRGICYAQVVEVTDRYKRNGADSPHSGDIVILMYPKSVYEAINKIMIDSGSHLGEIVADNNSIPIVIERETKNGGFPSYNVSLYPFGASKAFEDSNGEKGEDIYDRVISELPNILEEIVPSRPDQAVRDKIKTLSETMVNEYLKSTVVNPGDSDTQKPTDNHSENKAESIQDQVSAQSSTTQTGSDDNPECFGNYCQGEKKCMLCLKEVDCMNNSNK